MRSSPPYAQLAARFGSPLYVYDGGRIRAEIAGLKRAFRGALLCYSVKANGNLGLLRLIRSLGLGADVVSGGELARARKAGFDPRKVVFAGVGKTAQEMKEALDWGIRALTVESWEELAALGRAARARGRVAPAYLRVNPDIDGKSHAKTTTAVKRAKFGVALGELNPRRVLEAAGPGVLIRGIHVHLGSPVRDASLYGRAARVLSELGRRLAPVFPELEDLDLGSGLALDVAPARYAESIRRALRNSGRRWNLVMEPGRRIIAQAGALATRVVYRKTAGGRKMLVVDAGMNALIRPMLYDAVHPVSAPGRKGSMEAVTVAGPVCETGDILARDVRLPLTRAGDLLVIGDAGAYGFSMASQYNGRPRPAEVLWDRNRALLIRRRETYQDLWRGEER